MDLRYVSQTVDVLRYECDLTVWGCVCRLAEDEFKGAQEAFWTRRSAEDGWMLTCGLTT